MKLNMLIDLMKTEHNCHEGNGFVDVFRAFDRKVDLKTLDFLDFVRVPPKATIGRHRHGDNCEWYVIMQGEGKMIFCEKEIKVKPWDVLINPSFGGHALFNNTNEDINLIVFQFSGDNKHE